MWEMCSFVVMSCSVALLGLLAEWVFCLGIDVALSVSLFLQSPDFFHLTAGGNKHGSGNVRLLLVFCWIQWLMRYEFWN